MSDPFKTDCCPPGEDDRPRSEWLYFGWGQCSVCEDSSARLYKQRYPEHLRAVLDPPMCGRCWRSLTGRGP